MGLSEEGKPLRFFFSEVFGYEVFAKKRKKKWVAETQALIAITESL
jgi:hypothetical protein